MVGNSNDSTDEDDLSQLDALEVNKRFITSFLHIQGKLITKIGMESFVQCAIQMLREFRALIQNSPIAITCHRLLQLIALNMFAIDCSQLKDQKIACGARSEVQECAIIIGLLMFGIILERFLTVLQDAVQHQQRDSINENLQEANSNSASDNSAHNDSTTRKLILPEDAKVMLPAIKVWCDWMIRQQNVWNPPPCFNDYSKITSDPWLKLASLVTILDNFEFCCRENFSCEPKLDFELVKLHEDFTFAGFTPLLNVKLEPVYVNRSHDMDKAENDVRLQKILDFGKNVLCSCSPPILEKRTLNNGTSEYISVVQNRTEESSDSEILLECISDEDDDQSNNSSDVQLPSTILLNALTGKQSTNNVDNSDSSCDPTNNSNNNKENNDNVNHDEKKIDDKETNNDSNDRSNSTKNENNNTNKTETEATTTDTSSAIINNNDNNENNSAAEIRRLLRRKDELLRKQKMQEKYNERLQDILRQSTVALCIEVRPRFLVPDTNCFVDYLSMLQAIGNAYPLYQLMVPLVVINELEGLSKGLKPSQLNQITPSNQITSIGVVPISATIINDNKKSNTSSSNSRTDKEHALKVAEASKAAMEYLKTKPPAVKLVTTKGHQMKTFIVSEDDSADQKSNDDKILDTALNLCKSHKEERIGDTRHIVREVVLITKDRNLRVKALSNDLPVRELPDFVKWAGLGS
uniref:CSON005905 protein n=2 Tax=Culicoides sonorensis TaxID=179676 RepID=A0A336N3P0_CULSO